MFQNPDEEEVIEQAEVFLKNSSLNVHWCTPVLFTGLCLLIILEM